MRNLIVKILAVLLVICVLLVVTSCNKQKDSSSVQTTNNNSTVSTTKESDTKKSVAETWPSSPVQILVGANAGGGIDTAARLISKYMSEYFGQSFVVTNMSGGAGSIAATNVKTSKPDGYTFLVAHEALLTNKISGTTDFDYDGFDCGGIPFKVYTTCLLSKKYKSIDELVSAAKANPGTIKFGTELATNDTAIIAMMEEKFGVQFQLVDSGAVSDQIASMMGDHMDFMKAPVGLVKDYVASGDFNILAFFNENRNPDYPEIPTMEEEGVNFYVDKYFGCFFPKGTDEEIIKKFATALKEICAKPEFKEDADKVMYAVDYVSPEDMPQYFETCKIRLVEYQNLLESHYAL